MLSNNLLNHIISIEDGCEEAIETHKSDTISYKEDIQGKDVYPFIKMFLESARGHEE